MDETKPQVIIDTTLGQITLELDPQKAPITVKNFLDYVSSGFYDGTIFHRVIDGFMIQGGGFTESMKQKSGGAQIKNEADNGLLNNRGTIAMARTQVVDSATSQFFINVGDNHFLNHKGKDAASYGYAVFGKVIEGLETVDAIRKVATGTKGFHQDVPKDPVIINSAKIKE